MLTNGFYSMSQSTIRPVSKATECEQFFDQFFAGKACSHMKFALKLGPRGPRMYWGSESQKIWAKFKYLKQLSTLPLLNASNKPFWTFC